VNQESACSQELLAEYRGLAKWGLFLSLFHSIGLEAMKTLDTKDGFFMNNFNGAVEKWVKENKEKVNDIVLQVVNLVRDFEDVDTL